MLRGEHLQARLQQELRFIGQLGQPLRQGSREPPGYPMHRAELLASDVCRLGLARSNLSYLDFCCVLVAGGPLDSRPLHIIALKTTIMPTFTCVLEPHRPYAP